MRWSREEAWGMNGLHSARGTEATLLSAMKQKCLQITNRIVSRVLINIRHTLFMFPLMGYFLHVSLAPQVLMGRRVQREDGSCATPGFNLRQSACLACGVCAWKSVPACVCMHPTRSQRLRAVLYEGRKGSSNPDPMKRGSESIFGLFVLGMTF